MYIVDGLFNDNINFLNPEDIESMEVLKDPSSLAIFGVRGANGVIIITTKKAKEGQTRVNINTSFGWKSVVDKIAMTNADQFKELYNEQLTNEETALFDFSNWNASTDWQDEIFQNGFITNNNISITGASEKHSFYLGVGYSHEQGNIKHEKFSKVTINASNEYKLTDFFKVGFQLNGARILPADAKQVLGAIRTTPVAPVYNTEYGLYTALPEFQKAQMNNPMVDVDLKANTTKAENYRASGSIYGEIDFLKHFTARATFSMDYASDNGRTYTPIIKVYDPTVQGNVSTLGTGKTEVSQFKQNETKVQSDYVLTYTNSFADGAHNLTATAGFTTYYNSLSRLDGARKQGVGLVIPDDPDKWFVSIGDAATATNGSTQWERTTVSMLARVIYNYKGKYLFNGSFRRDGSSAFSYTGNQWQNFYSVGAGWLMSEEEFMKDAREWLTNLKLRASYGNLGNQSALNDYYPWMNNYDLSAKYPFGGSLQPGYYQKNYKIATISWEKARTWGVGFDATLLDKVTVAFDYYDRKTTGIIMDVPVPPEFGLGAYKDNVGSMVNRGMELTVSYNDKWGDWSFGATANLAYNKNKILDLDGVSSLVDGDLKIRQVGEAFNTYRLYKTEGFFQSDAEAKAWQDKHKNDPGYPFKKNFKAGDLIYSDANGDGLFNTDDRVLCGSSDPSYTFGLNLNAGYKNFDLSMMFTGVAGVKRMIDTNGFGGEWSGDDVHPNNIWLDAWTPDNKNAKMPRIAVSKTSNNLENSDFWLQDGSYVRLKNVQFGYTLPKNTVKSWGIENIRVYYSGENLLTFHKMMIDADPELGSLYSFPINQTHAIGVNITF